MLAYYTPSMEFPVIRSNSLDRLQKDDVWEVGRWSSHYSDEMIKRFVLLDRKLTYYMAEQGGLWLFRHAGVVSMLFKMETKDTTNPISLKSFGITESQLSSQNPEENST